MKLKKKKIGFKFQQILSIQKQSNRMNSAVVLSVLQKKRHFLQTLNLDSLSSELLPWLNPNIRIFWNRLANQPESRILLQKKSCAVIETGKISHQKIDFVVREIIVRVVCLRVRSSHIYSRVLILNDRMVNIFELFGAGLDLFHLIHRNNVCSLLLRLIKNLL